MSDCKVFQHEILEALDGSAMSHGARAHAESCRACGEEVRGRERLRALVGGLAKVEAPADFDYRLRARMAAAGMSGRRSPLRGLRLVYAFAPVAAAACFLVVSTALYLRQSSQTRPAEAPVGVASEAARNATALQQAASVPTIGKVEASKRTGERPVQVASAPPARSSVQRVRAASRPSREVAASPEGRAAGLQRNTAIASVYAAPVITRQGVPFALKTPAEPMRMILMDERGAGRVVPMRSVSFGSQELIARENPSRQVSVAENEGVW